MAKFITRHEIVRCLHRIIKEAEEELVLVSPFIKTDNTTKSLLKNMKRSTRINVIYGKKELKLEEKGFLEELSIKAIFREHLHAKCYLNENEALLTSMNLYVFSQEHNDEMGILVSKKDDPDLYAAIYRQVMAWTGSRQIEESASVMRAVMVQALLLAKDPDLGFLGASEYARILVSIDEDVRLVVDENGFCVRCKANMPFTTLKPYCRRCYNSWIQYKNLGYKEKHCHMCGQGADVSMLNAICFECGTEIKRRQAGNP